MKLFSKRARTMLSLLLLFITILLLTAVPWPQNQSVPNPVAAGGGEWPTLGANPQRTSWTSEEVRGDLDVEWYRKFEPFIPNRVQIIAANGLLFISTARGLYAIDAASGNEVWIYPTEMPLGHSPTIANGVAYVGGLDHKIHAVNANTGAGLWTFEAGAGFETNPLVVDDKLYAGSRDGTFYAVYISGPNTGELAWKYETGGPILYSAAYNSGTLFFASNDSFAYALNAATGGLQWKSAKLPGQGFYSYWPVVFEDKVIFSGSNAYGTVLDWSGSAQMGKMELLELYAGLPANAFIGSIGTVAGDWVSGTPTINANRIYDYFNNKPYRKTVFVLNQSNGVESTTAPVLWTGTHSGNRYPPVVGSDGVLYQHNNYSNDPSIARGHISGWQPNVNVITGVSSDVGAVDEPHAAAAGGDVIYWNLCCDRQTGAFDITMPNTGFANGYLNQNREWIYYGYNLDQKVPGYNTQYFSAHPNIYTKPYASFGGVNGTYGFHGEVNPPIPYNGRVYIHRSNVLMAFNDGNFTPAERPMSTLQAAPDSDIASPDVDWVVGELEAEITEMLAAGHLRAGYISHGLLDNSEANNCGDSLTEYFSNSADTIYTLLMALPHLSSGLQSQVRTYIQEEYANYPPYQYNHIGWRDGAPRETFILPPDMAAELGKNGPETQNFTLDNNGGWQGEGAWGRNPFAYYALWKYAVEFGNANAVWSASQSVFWLEFNDQPSDTLLLNMPMMHNAYIAGYIGYLELEALAGQPKSNNVQNELNRLLQLRASTFTPHSAYISSTINSPYCRAFNISSNFIYLVPELADYLRNNAYGPVLTAIAEYERVAPYWFVSFFSGAFAENVLVTLHDAHALFMAKAIIVGETGDVLADYLDVPGFATGDLFYLQKLVLLLENGLYGYRLSATPNIAFITEGGSGAFVFSLESSGGFAETVNIQVNNPHATVQVTGAPASVSSYPAEFTITLTDLHNPGSLPQGQFFPVTVTFTGGGFQKSVEITLLVNGTQYMLPILRR